jgi:hypothetical protein
LQGVYDFEARATEYKLKVNDLEAIIKAKAQGELNITITSQAQNYDHCVEVRGEEDIKSRSEYYCYNMADQVLDEVGLPALMG